MNNHFKDIDTLINPAGVLGGMIADAHRAIAREFINKITKEQAIKIWRYFDRDIIEMDKYFNRKFGSYYMLWTPINDSNVFISDWVCGEIVNKVVSTDN